MSDHLRIYLLGGLRVEHGGREFPRFRTKKTASLLAYFAFHSRFAVSREVLIDQFWRDDPPEKARNSLNTAISWLGRHLGTFASFDEPLFISERHSVKLNGGQVWTDVDEFRRAASAAMRTGPDRGAAIREAISLYQGDLLQGFYDDWIVASAFELREIFDALKSLEQRLSVDSEESYEPSTVARSRTDNLPRIANTFVGRQTELAELKSIHSASPLASIVGAGGVGKTRLAIEYGRLLRQLGEQVWLISFAGSPADVSIPEEIQRQLGIQRDPSMEAIDQLSVRFQGVAASLILDNLEHINSIEAELPRLMDRLPATKLIVTTRVRLNLESERVLKLEPLAVPDIGDDLETLRSNPSAELFVSRSVAALPGFTLDAHNVEAVKQLCKKLEGISLMIELAAARVHVYGVREMVEQMDRPLEFLVSRVKDRDPRHRSIRAAIDWSYRLLSLEARETFPKLALARGGWTLSTATYVLQKIGLEEIFQELCDASLLSSSVVGDSRRFTMHAVLREFAVELLEEEQREAIQDRRCAQLLDLASSAGTTRQGPRPREWLDAIAAEIENIRDCLQWAVEHGREASAAELATLLSLFWERRGHWKEANAWLERAIRTKDIPEPLRARAYLAAGVLSRWLGDHDSATERFREAADIFARLGDRAQLAEVWWCLGALLATEGDYEKAERYFVDSLSEAEEAGNPQNPGLLLHLGMVAFDRGRFESARDLYVRALSVAHEQADRFNVARVLTQQADDFLRLGLYDAAKPVLEESIAIYRDLGDPLWMGVVLTMLGRLHYLRGESHEAMEQFQAATCVAEELGDHTFVAAIQLWKAKIAMQRGDERIAESLLRQIMGTSSKLKDPRTKAESAALLACIVYRQDLPAAVRQLRSALKELKRDPACLELHAVYLITAELALQFDLQQNAAELAGTVRTFYRSTGAHPDPFVLTRLIQFPEAPPSGVSTTEAWGLANETLGLMSAPMFQMEQ
jgi:predicted ATPase